MPPEERKSQESFSIPFSIVIAGALIAGAVYFSGSGTVPPSSVTAAAGNIPDTAVMKDTPAVTATDHILGNPNAPIKIIEYTDLECPFCKQFHTTMKSVMETYGKDGKVAWIMRNFPLAQLHPNAPKLAEASECVASVGGNDAYWKFLDSMFAQAPIGSFFDLTKLDSTVSGIGVNVQAFETCYQKGTFKEKIEKEFNDAVATGGKGTPFSVIVSKDGKNTAIPGALPYDRIKEMIETALAE